MFIRRLCGHVRRHLVAYLALFFALSGSAVASTSYITKSETITQGDLAGSTYGNPVIAAGKVTNSKLAHSSLSINTGTGLSGGGSIALGGSRALSLAGGYQLPQSCASGQVPNANGSGGWTCGTPTSVAQMMGGSIGTLSGASAQYLAPVGLSTPDGTESNVEAGASAVASTASNLSVSVSTAPGTSTVWKFILRVNGSNTTLTCQIADTATACNDKLDTASIPAGADVSLIADPNGGPQAARVTFGWTDRS